MTNHELLAENYIFYEKHHNNYLNKIIHLFCIPVLVWTSTVFLSLIPIKYVIDTDNYILKLFEINMASFIALLYCIYYSYLDKAIGRNFMIFFGICLFSSNYFIRNYNYQIAIYLHIGSWILQILSHKFIEGNQPALLSGIFQSFTMAPFFVFLEILFFLGKRSDILNTIKLIKKKNKKMEPFQIKLD